MSLIDFQKTIVADPVVTCTVGGTQVGPYVGRYKWWEKADSFGRMALWLDNSGGRFNNLAGDWPNIKRGKEVVLSRGLRVGGVSETAAAPTYWVETLMYVLYRDTPYLLLDCIDWVGRLRYYRYAAVESWVGAQVKDIVEEFLGEVGLTLASGSFTSLAIDYEVRPTRSLWSALRDVMAKVPEVLFAKPGKEIGFKVLDSGASASYTFAYNPPSAGSGGEGHPLLDDTDVAESTAVYNSITVKGGPELEYTGTAENSDEISLLGYRRRRYITDRRLNSDAECEQRAEAELEFWNARGTAGVIVARPHFTARLFDVVEAPAPLWGGPAVGSGHITKITEWYNFGNRKYDQALVIGEVPDAAILHVLDPDDEEPIPPEDDDPGDAGGGAESGDTSTPSELEQVEEGLVEIVLPDGHVTEGTIADAAVTTDKIADDAVTGAKISGDIGLGAAQASPVGLLHGYDGISGFAHWEFNGVDGTTRTIIANGAGDVTAALCVQYVLKSSGGTSPDDWQAGLTTLEPDTSVLLYSDEADLQLRVTSVGAVEVQRTAGASTFKIAMWLVWI